MMCPQNPTKSRRRFKLPKCLIFKHYVQTSEYQEGNKENFAVRGWND